MSGKSNFFSKGKKYIKIRYNKIMFAFFGTAMALPPAVFNNCKGSCSNCYNCLISGTPIVVLVFVSLGRKLYPFKNSRKKQISNNH
jgi:hypothetical protein